MAGIPRNYSITNIIILLFPDNNGAGLNLPGKTSPYLLIKITGGADVPCGGLGWGSAPLASALGAG